MKRAPVSSINTAPSPRTASEISGKAVPPLASKRGRVELHEFQMLQLRAGLGGEDQAAADRRGRVGAVAEQPADAAGGQQHAVGRQGDGAGRGLRQHAGHLAVAQQQLARGGGEKFDRGGGAGDFDQRAHDFRAGPVAIGVQDARALMRGLEPEGERSARHRGRTARRSGAKIRSGPGRLR